MRKEKAREGRFPVGRFFAWKTRDVSLGCMTIILGYLSLYASTYLGVPVGVVGALMMGSKIFDAVTDPLIASWSDRAVYKGGRRIPFMKASAIPFAVTTVAVFILPQTSSIAANNAMIFALLMLFYLFMTI